MGKAIICSRCGKSTGYCGCCGDGPWFTWDDEKEECTGGPYCDQCFFEVTGVRKTAHVVPKKLGEPRRVEVSRPSPPSSARMPGQP
jgi:hypothetical protein